MSTPEGFERVPCKLTGEDGNAYAIMARVTKALKSYGYAELVDGYIKEATSGDYDNLLKVSLKYVYDEGGYEDD